MPELGSQLQQEISLLEKQLAEKRAALHQEALPEEKETLREVIGERIQEHLPAYQPAQPTGPIQDDKHGPPDPHDSASYASPALKEKVQELVNLVFNKSLEDGIKEVTKAGNPALIDAFHDVLTDHLYGLMLERKKVEIPK